MDSQIQYYRKLMEMVPSEMREAWEMKNLEGTTVPKLLSEAEELDNKVDSCCRMVKATKNILCLSLLMLAAGIFIAALIKIGSTMHVFWTLVGVLGLCALNAISGLWLNERTLKKVHEIEVMRERCACSLKIFESALNNILPRLLANLRYGEKVDAGLHLRINAIVEKYITDLVFKVLCAEQMFRSIREDASRSSDEVVEAGRLLSRERKIFEEAWSTAQDFKVVLHEKKYYFDLVTQKMEEHRKSQDRKSRIKGETSAS